MKPKIHPTYYPKAKATCACGNKFIVGSTEETIKVEICHLCHPFFTGKQKLIDTARRVEKFQDKLAKKSKLAASKAKTRKSKNKPEDKK